MQTVINGLIHQWMIWNFTITLIVLDTSKLIGKYNGYQIFRCHALQWSRRTLARRVNAEWPVKYWLPQRQRVANNGESSMA